MKRSIATLLAGLALGSGVTVAAAESGVWQRTANSDGSVTFRSGVTMPKRATDVTATHSIYRTRTGQTIVRFQASYCQRGSICDLPKR